MNIYSRGAPEPGREQVRDVGLRSDPPLPDDERDGEDAFSLSNLLLLLWANIWILVVGAVLGAGHATWSYYKEIPLYTSSATVVLEPNVQNVVEFRSVVSSSTSTFYAMNTEVLLLRSHDLVGRIVDALALDADPEFNPALRPPASGWKEMIGYDQIMVALGYADGAPTPETGPSKDTQAPGHIDQIMSIIGLGQIPPPPQPTAEQARERAISILFSKLQVSPIEDTYAFRLIATTNSPQKSAAIANKFAELYVQKKREISFQATNEAMTWLSARVVELKAELEAAEAAVEDFASGLGLVSEEGLVASSIRLKSISERQAEQEKTAEDLKARISKLSDLRLSQDFGALSEALEDPQLRRLSRALAENPDDSATREGFDQLLEDLLQVLRAQANQFESQSATLSAPIGELQQTIESQSSNLVQLRQLRREAEAARLVYEYSLRRMKEISVQEGLDQADVRVLSEALVPGGPSSPRAQSTFLRGAAIGLFLGAIFVLLRNMLRMTFQTPEELEAYTGLINMGAIPKIRASEPRDLIKYLRDKPSSGLAEAIRDLRTAIQLSDMDTSPKVIMVSSSLPGEGKTSTAIVLAQSWASAGKKVLLLDCDLRRGTLKKQFKVPNKSGLISVLKETCPLEDAVYHDEATGIDLLIADSAQVTGVDVFYSKRYASFIAEMREIYDFIVVDTPPVLMLPDARVIAQTADAVLYIVQWHKTSRRMVRSGLEHLYQVNVHVSGVVLTQLNPKRMDRYGYYGYGYGRKDASKYYLN